MAKQAVTVSLPDAVCANTAMIRNILVHLVRVGAVNAEELDALFVLTGKDLESGRYETANVEGAQAYLDCIYQNLGITHRERGDLVGAEGWYTRAEEASRDLDETSAVVEIGNGRGQLYLARRDLAAAEMSFRKALAAMAGEGPNAIRVAVRTNLAEALLLRGRTLEAGVMAREAEEEAIRGRHVSRLPAVYRVLAQIVAERGEGEAFVFVEHALKIAREAGLPPIQEALTLRTWADLREAQGEHDLASQARARAEELLSGHPIGTSESEEDSDHPRPGGAS